MRREVGMQGFLLRACRFVFGLLGRRNSSIDGDCGDSVAAGRVGYGGGGRPEGSGVAGIVVKSGGNPALKEFLLGGIVVMVDGRTHDAMTMLQDAQKKLVGGQWDGVLVATSDTLSWQGDCRHAGNEGLDSLLVANGGMGSFLKAKALAWQGTAPNNNKSSMSH